MGTRISLANHLSVEELEQSYRQAKVGIESRQFHVNKVTSCREKNWGGQLNHGL